MKYLVLQMKQIKEATKNGELLSRAMNICLTLPSASSTTLEKSTQTDKEQRPFLSDKDISFLKEIRRSQNKRSRRVDEPVVLEKAIKLETPPVEILDIFDEPYVSEDNLELHLSAMFNDQTSPVLNPKIQEPSDNDYDPELKQLLLAIDENNRLIKTRSAEEKVLPDKSPVNQMLVEGTRQELMKSIWPCKLYHHRKEFQKNFLKFSEKHFRNSDLIKQRFLELFGEDSDDDDIVAFSPSHNMDSEMILSSSKKRVAAMVVQHLMEPFKKGLVGDKATFKVMAQDFTECIIANDMYPSFMEVKGVIDGYFCDEQDDSKIDINALLQ